MAVRETLEKILELGKEKKYIDKEKKEKPYFQPQKLSEIAKGCCEKANLWVIDFDETKENVVGKMNHIYKREKKTERLESLKSCDALKILPKQAKIDFIEMKKVAHLQAESIEKQTADIQKHNFHKKVTDSLCVMDFLLSSHILGLNEDEIAEYEAVEKKFILVINVNIQALDDLDPLQAITITLNSNNLIELCKTALIASPEYKEKNLTQLLLKDCAKLEAFYCNE